MELRVSVIKYILFVLFCMQIYAGQGNLLPQEQLLNATFCDTSNLNISCDTNEMIGIYTLKFWYHFGCETTCCTYDSNHTKTDADTALMAEIRRECSGRIGCNLDLSGVRHFGPVGVKNPSYAIVQYYCIPDSRRTSICSGVELASQGLPLYLTNENYPSVTTGDSTCSCSLEVSTCSLGVNLFIIDLDLYFNIQNCEQQMEFENGNEVVIERLGCESDNSLNVTTINLSSHYVKINFIDNSTADQEGYFFLGLAATEMDSVFNLSCSAKTESTCLGCGDESSIPHGNVSLVDASNSSYGALADVVCDPGYEANKTTIRCQETAEWEHTECFPKDCGDRPVIPNGIVNAVDQQNTSFGSLANVTCSEGFEANKNKVTCTESGRWEIASCSAKDCGSLFTLENGKIMLAANGETYFGSTAIISCREGYSSPVTRIKCLHSGEWQRIQCTIIDCGKPSNIPHGNVTLNDSNTTYNSFARVTCRDGYKSGKQAIKCTEAGTWETTSCEKDYDENILLIILPSLLTPVIFIIIILLVLYIIQKCRQNQLNKHRKVEENVASSKYEEFAGENQIQSVDNPAYGLEEDCTNGEQGLDKEG